MYSIPLDAINGSPHFLCVLLPNSVTEHEQPYIPPKPEALPCNVFNVKKKKLKESYAL